MIEIKDLLLRFSNLLLSEEIKKESIRQIISDAIGSPISLKDIKIKTNTVYLNIKPIYKNEILRKKDKISASLEASLGQHFPKNIR
ncbi:MAG: hypothetical protein V4486_00260 [Patescibacteria group bacterium]